MSLANECSNRFEPGRRSSKPVLVPIENLRPTQMAVGMRSVKRKRLRLESRSSKSMARVLSGRPIPAVRGPDGEIYIIDCHHFGLALWHAEVERAYAHIVDDKSHLRPSVFWRRMEEEGRLYPFDEEGRRVPAGAMPLGLHELRHDPFRDLAREVRAAGGFAKSRMPYAEFQWANFFRIHLDQALVRRNCEAAIEKAIKLCRCKDAAALPGYIARRG